MDNQQKDLKQNPKNPLRNNKLGRNLLIFLVIFIVIISFFNFIKIGSAVREEKVSYTTFLQMVEKDQISKVIIRGQVIEGKVSDRYIVKTFAPMIQSLSRC